MEQGISGHCGCLESARPPCSFAREIGVDMTNFRYGDVSLMRCDRCGRYWLLYEVEYASYTQSGRWFLGLIDEERAETLQPEDAAPYLASLDWYFRGGAYYFGEITKVSGPPHVEL